MQPDRLAAGPPRVEPRRVRTRQRSLERVPIRRVVIDGGRVADAGHGPGDHVGFGRMEVAARRVDAQRPPRLAELFPRRQPQRMPQDVSNPSASCGLRVRMADRRQRRRPRRASGAARRRRAGKRSERIAVGTPSRDSRATGRTGRNGAWCRRDRRERRRAPGQTFDAVLGGLHAAVDFLDRLRDLRAAPFVGRGEQLTIELGARQPQRLERFHLDRDRAPVLPCCWRVRSRSNSSIRS